MQMSETSEPGPNRSYASARAVGISRRSPFRSASRELRGARGLPQGFGPTVRA